MQLENDLFQFIRYKQGPIPETLYKYIGTRDRDQRSLADYWVHFRKEDVPEILLKNLDPSFEYTCNKEIIVDSWIAGNRQQKPIPEYLKFKNFQSHKTTDGYTPLMMWIISRKTPIPDELFYEDCQIQKNCYGQTPLMIWIQYRNDEIPEKLKYKDYQLDKDNSGFTVTNYWITHMIDQDLPKTFTNFDEASTTSWIINRKTPVPDFLPKGDPVRNLHLWIRYRETTIPKEYLVDVEKPYKMEIPIHLWFLFRPGYPPKELIFPGCQTIKSCGDNKQTPLIKCLFRKHYTRDTCQIPKELYYKGCYEDILNYQCIQNEINNIPKEYL